MSALLACLSHDLGPVKFEIGRETAVITSALLAGLTQELGSVIVPIYLQQPRLHPRYVFWSHESRLVMFRIYRNKFRQHMCFHAVLVKRHSAG